MSAVMIESRPNGATNHGMPPDGKYPSAVRSDSMKRSSELREIHASKSGESLANFVDVLCHATQSRSATTGEGSVDRTWMSISIERRSPAETRTATRPRAGPSPVCHASTGARSSVDCFTPSIAVYRKTSR